MVPIIYPQNGDVITGTSCSVDHIPVSKVRDVCRPHAEGDVIKRHTYCHCPPADLMIYVVHTEKGDVIKRHTYWPCPVADLMIYDVHTEKGDVMTRHTHCHCLVADLPEGQVRGVRGTHGER